MIPPVVGAWHSAIAAAAGALLLSVAIERFAEPAAGVRARPAAAWCLHGGSALLCFTALLVLVHRPVFSALLSIVLWTLLVQINNAKYRALREPFLFSDFALFSQAVRYPRLYLPFLDMRHTVAGGLVSVSGCYLGITVEPTLIPRIGVDSFATMIAAGLVASAMLLLTGIRYGPEPSFEPVADMRHLGLLASLWLYRLAESKTVAKAPSTGRFGAGLPSRSGRAGNRLPDLIVIQSESFFDARRLWPGVRPDILQMFDRLAAHGMSGRLVVPAWGANTMRTEFSFLTGIPALDLGVHRFNPFRRYARRPLPGIARRLQALGYRTICIHPHPIGFFGRDRVYPHLGFDRFIDIESFRAAEKFGPYISDASVACKVAEMLDTEQSPLFVFAITMENHGPLHLEKFSAEEEKGLYTAPPPGGFGDLTVYLRHLANADRMLDSLWRRLSESDRDGALCFFGDHVPSLPDVYHRLDFDDGRTDYLIWRKDSPFVVRRDIDVAALGALLLDAADIDNLAAGLPPG